MAVARRRRPAADSDAAGEVEAVVAGVNELCRGDRAVFAIFPQWRAGFM
ncbi:hypothetical protein [Burkholderia sp. BCC1977]|nr:hypothetical protein [Burkholderia sp. BCC1977]